ncbi:membrane protein insertase YidC [Verrucomicrobiaceae bacterium R5-34]|uniref:Membrane protein insertase YidC n=1 Tax=Oceaniferula flava TaxID=2800421 RepID=A0AAE2SE57_9BACT|nr:membrane protein insertase YidC [Oceaniferula flavus]MBK1831983.1 membrane protein insertase YidC [Verrucomicrobiaceae bacterium R5-34]MBK1855249.1 membrane protein insertase YidC [Oceaniferula flavus]MBM1136555.1 membrane protein insertase YidC [Oceaniferula flavus]
MDRKGWIILTICGILLAANYYFMPKQAPEENKPTLEETDLTEVPESEAKPEVGEMVREPNIPKVGEKTAVLTSGKEGGPQVEFHFTSNGGGIAFARLLDQKKIHAESEFVTINEHSPAPIGAFTEGVDDYLALHYQLVEKDGVIFCEATTPGGLKITKRWSLEEDADAPGAAWRLNLKVTLTNTGKNSINIGNYSMFCGSVSPLHPREWENQGGAYFLDDGSFTIKDSNWFKKGFWRDARPLFQESVEELEYAGVSNQFFTSMIQPKVKQPSTYWAKASKIDLPGADPEKPKYSVRSGFSLPVTKLASEEAETLSYSVYLGPKSYSVLKKLDGDAKEVMNYGWFTPISVFLYSVLNWLHDVAFSKTADTWAWGLSIIALTILIRCAIWPLHNKSTRTMKRMSKLQPIMKDLREKYADNPTKLNQETMKLYKEYQINPMGGCLPMFLQIPIFFGYYKMLQFAVELRGESFLWVDDLSMPDTLTTLELPFSLPFLGDALPINLLPILMAVTMVLQMKMTPKTGDKMQQRIFMLMPLMFFFFCYNFASALALYWTTQNIFSIGQTWLTNRMPEAELVKRTPKKNGKKTFMERMAERMEEQQRAQKMGQGDAKKPMRDATPETKKKKRNPKTGG